MAPPQLTADAMLSLPRPGAAIANPSGTYYLMPYSHFSFDTARTSKNVAIGKIDRHNNNVSNAAGGKHDHSPVTDFLKDLRYSEVAWLDDTTAVYLRPRNSDANSSDVDVTLSDKAFKKELAADDNTAPGQEIWAKALEGSPYKLGEVHVDISDFKTVLCSANKAILAFSAEVYPEEPTLDAVERLDKEYKEKLEGADVLVYNRLYVRHWDEWISDKKKLVFFVELAKGNADKHSKELDDLDIQSLSSSEGGLGDDTPSSSSSQWSITTAPRTPLAGLDNIECPVRPFGDADDFDLTPTHLAFVAKDPHLPEAWHSRMHVYMVPLFPKNESEKVPKCLTSQGGARSHPMFSPIAKNRGETGQGKLAWLEMRKDGYEADRNRLMIYDLEKDIRYGLSEVWENSPASLAWGEDESTIYIAMEENGHKKLYVLDVPETPRSAEAASIDIKPRKLTSSGTVSSYQILPSIVTKSNQKTSTPSSPTSLLVTLTSLTSPNEAFLLQVPTSVREQPQLKQISAITTGLVEPLQLKEAEEFWFSGAAPARQVHGFILKPHGYEEGKRYGLAFLVHGGPQSAWLSSWSTRWNPQVWAAAGYVVVAINPTGSTGYGQEFTDAINREWGGRPFKDLVAGLEFVKRVYKDMIDDERMVMAGASYGGYMANWIQGHNDVTNFKAIICHDGILDTRATWFNTEEIYFPEHDLGGTPWEVESEYTKWSPINHVRNWKTPQLVIHGGKDYRLPETEGLGVFNALQRKGIPSKLVYFPNENHWVLNPLNSRRWHKEIFDWINEWIGVGPSQ